MKGQGGVNRKALAVGSARIQQGGGVGRVKKQGAASRHFAVCCHSIFSTMKSLMGSGP